MRFLAWRIERSMAQIKVRHGFWRMEQHGACEYIHSNNSKMNQCDNPKYEVAPWKNMLVFS